jgi:hypothetical protein
MRDVKELADATRVPSAVLARVFNMLVPPLSSSSPSTSASSGASKKAAAKSKSSQGSPQSQSSASTPISVDEMGMRAELRSSIVVSLVRMAGNDIEEARRLVGTHIRWTP